MTPLYSLPRNTMKIQATALANTLTTAGSINYTDYIAYDAVANRQAFYDILAELLSGGTAVDAKIKSLYLHIGYLWFEAESIEPKAVPNDGREIEPTVNVANSAMKTEVIEICGEMPSTGVYKLRNGASKRELCINCAIDAKNHFLRICDELYRVPSHGDWAETRGHIEARLQTILGLLAYVQKYKTEDSTSP